MRHGERRRALRARRLELCLERGPCRLLLLERSDHAAHRGGQRDRLVVRAAEHALRALQLAPCRRVREHLALQLAAREAEALRAAREEMAALSAAADDEGAARLSAAEEAAAMERAAALQAVAAAHAAELDARVEALTTDKENANAEMRAHCDTTMAALSADVERLGCATQSPSVVLEAAATELQVCTDYCKRSTRTEYITYRDQSDHTTCTGQLT